MDTTPAPEAPMTEILDRLRSLDPADAPDLADELAATLAAELEEPEPAGEQS